MQGGRKGFKKGKGLRLKGAKMQGEKGQGGKRLEREKNMAPINLYCVPYTD